MYTNNANFRALICNNKGVQFCIHNDNLLISCSRDGTVKIWELQSGYCSKTLSDVHDGEWVKRIAVSYDGSLMATCSVDKTLKVWDIKNDFDEVGCYRGHDHVVEDIVFSNPNTDDILLGKDPNDDDSNEDSDDDSDDENGGGIMNGSGGSKKQKPPRFIASASRDKLIIIWNIKSGDRLMSLQGHENWVRSLVFHPCGRFLISCADDKSIRMWDLNKKRIFQKIDNCHNGFISSVDWHPTASLLASVSTSKDVKIWCHDKSVKNM